MTDDTYLKQMLESLPLDLAEHLLKLGRAEWGATAEKSAEEHGADTVNSVNLTAEHFEQTGPQAMHGLYLEGTETVLCHTGTSPNSPNTARALAGAWNKLVELAALRVAQNDQPPPQGQPTVSER